MMMFSRLLLLAAVARGLVPQSVVVIGGSSGMGKAAAKAVVARGGRVLLASRSRAKLDAARAEILAELGRADGGAGAGAGGDRVALAVLDARDEAAVAAFAEGAVAEFGADGLVVTAAGSAPHGAIDALPTAATRELFDSKFWGAYLACKASAFLSLSLSRFSERSSRRLSL